MGANHDWCSRNDSQKPQKTEGFCWLFLPRQEPFVSGSQGPPFPPTFKLAVLGIPSKKRVVSWVMVDEMGVLNGKGAKRALCMILFCSSNRFICRGSSLRIRCAHLLAHIWLHAMAWPCAYNHGTLGRAPKKHPVKIVWTVWGGLCWYNSFKGKLWSWCPKTIENLEQKQVGGFRTSQISSFS